ncbi:MULTISPECIES: nucleotidyltransferase domain-containing protein [unclassified Sphingobium]|uniref:nucleotidyltransferase domain-containing protein n=1 Tax=unclassified Sphingobium TaxID=2611147 RepID=UPI00119A18C7|nr:MULTISPECIES: nucleotidyltransferase domain-containing protein [unclassified Sphingobium]MBG6118540.1 putative nucleotidyltransferase [Sphingobium sp. JAI105]TWC98759.1 hypothetical protein FB595_1269 [Sphingobium sp. AEW010]TWD18349.1 hypothetical protein FB596_1279 [Sphingobium sp. AEW013]TWD21007.1 hypothetical protein FB594_12729 [Sphingobium sp. AEW001]
MSSFSLEPVMVLLRKWAEALDTMIGSGGIYLFGSSIFRDGQRFEPGHSDIDLVVVIPDDLRSAPDRAEYAENLRCQVAELEKSLLEPLGRKNADKPICSVIAATRLEIEADIHKSNVTSFFSRNVFRPLHVVGADGPAPGAGTLDGLSLATRNALAAVQQLRNVYLSVSPNGTRKLQNWTGELTIPKEMARSAAGLAPLLAPSAPGDEFDTRLGISELSLWLYSHRSDSQAFYRLYDWIAARQNGGKATDDTAHLRPDQYLLLAEAIYDLARERLNPQSSRASAPPPTDSAPEPQPNDMPARIATTEERALECSFLISDANTLVGEDDELKAKIAEATYNLDHRLEPAFTVVYTEALQLAEAVATNEAKREPESRLAHVAARQRRRQLVHRASIYESGFRFILFYQRLLFDAATRDQDLRIALRAFAQRVLIDHARIGGVLEAWANLEDLNVRVGFSLGAKQEKKYLKSLGFSDIMELAAENQPLKTMPSDLVARYFVPELVYDYVTSGRERPDRSQTERDLFTVGMWSLGVH